MGYCPYKDKTKDIRKIWSYLASVPCLASFRCNIFTWTKPWIVTSRCRKLCYTYSILFLYLFIIYHFSFNWSWRGTILCESLNCYLKFPAVHPKLPQSQVSSCSSEAVPSFQLFTRSCHNLKFPAVHPKLSQVSSCSPQAGPVNCSPGSILTWLKATLSHTKSCWNSRNNLETSL